MTRSRFGLIIAALALMVAPNLSAGICASTTDCTLNLTVTNAGFSTTNTSQTGSFGTVHLVLSSNVATITVTLASGFNIINTGFPGSFGFNDTLGGGLTINGFAATDTNCLTNTYCGAQSEPDTSSNNLTHFDGFGNANDAGATSGPSAGSSHALNSVSFTVSDGTSLTDVNQLLSAFNPAGGDASPIYFAVDAFDSNTGGNLGGKTGLLGVTGTAVPEPRSYLTLLIAGFGAMAFVFQRRRRKEASAS